MSVEFVRPEPCGSCVSCGLAAEVRKCLEFIDRRFMPDMQAAAREITEAKWYGWDHGYKIARSRYHRIREQWGDARNRILVPSVIAGMTCCTTLGVIIVKNTEPPEPREVNAVPSSMRDEPAHPDPRAGCYRCGAAIDRASGVHEIEVCGGCFGKETA